MKRLRHPIRAIREPFGTAGLIVACIALVAALGGGAYAASGGLTAKQKKEVKKIARSFQGSGPQGPVGPGGAAGAAGANGKDGAAGADGANGSDGKSVVVTEIPTEETECEELGGAMVKQEGATSGVEVCNGNPAEYPSTLPSGRSEQGVWTFGGEADAFEMASISFPIRLGFQPNIIWVKPGATPGQVTGCPGAFAEPEAAPGNLCIFANTMSNAGNGADKEPNTIYNLEAGEAFVDGVVMEFLATAGSEHYGWGTWAVKAPTS